MDTGTLIISQYENLLLYTRKFSQHIIFTVTEATVKFYHMKI